MFMADAYRDVVGLLGEQFALTSADGQSAALRGVYDRRTFVGEVNGAEYRAPDYRIGCASADLPDWVAEGNRVDIRSDTLHITSLEPDGAGLTYLVCRPGV